MPKQNIPFVFNELLPRFYKSAWQFWPNYDSFRQALVTERRRQCNIEKQLNKLENRMSFRMSDDPAALGTILSKNDRVLKQSDKAIITEKLKGITLIQSKAVSSQDQLLFDTTGHHLKRGKQENHVYNMPILWATTVSQHCETLLEKNQ